MIDTKEMAHRAPSSHRGYTLLEVIMVLTVSAALLMLSVPSIVTSIRNNDVASQSVSLLAMLNFTKSEAIRRNTVVNMVLTMTDDGWEAVVEDPNNESEIEGCDPGELRCTTQHGAVLTIAVADPDSEGAEKVAKSGMEAPPAPEPEPEPLPEPEPEPEPQPDPDPEPEPEPEPEVSSTFTVTFNNRGYIRGSDDAWLPETMFLQHELCAGNNQRVRIDITPTGQISSCNLACDSTAACP
ncbi:MAG: GspH/FimT family pseudopilin [Xanthomonadales bacterium]|nr:GspH/FimT family pseudopilin [Xanthomonadales bacterium]